MLVEQILESHRYQGHGDDLLHVRHPPAKAVEL
jgi:hypothetical protein